MQIFNGKAHSLLLDEQIKAYLNTTKYDKQLVIVMVGNNSESEKYVALKVRFCEKFGIPCKVLRYDLDTILSDIVNELHTLSLDPSVGGIIIQLPLPTVAHNSLLNIIPYYMDVDLLSEASKDTYYSGDFKRLSPVVRATKYFIANTRISLKDLSVCILGEGNLVGRPLAYFLKSHGCHVTVINNYITGTKLDYQLVILSAGVPGLVNCTDLSLGCHVIDFGSSVVNGSTAGDLNIMTNCDHLGHVSPSPGGMGPLVIRFLIMNLLEI